MPATAGHNYLLGPVIAVAVVGFLVLLARWAFAAPRRTDRRPDYGLLVPVVTAPDPELASRVRERLGEHGIPGTLVPAGKGYDAAGRPWPLTATQVLVFPDDLERARLMVRR